MKNINVLLLITGLLFLSVNGYSANLLNQSDAVELHVGDKIPDVNLNNLLRNNMRNGKLSDFAHGRAIIIDFFATWCGACINKLPILNQLQKKYGDQIGILVVSRESEDIVNKFLVTNKNMADIGLSFLPADHELNAFFPHVEIPHEVWIDRNGMVKAITNADSVTDKNVFSLINGKLPTFPVKIDLVSFSVDVPFFKNGNGGDGNEYFSRSILTAPLKGADSPMLFEPDSVGKVKRIAAINHDPLQMFFMAYGRMQIGLINLKRIIFETRDSTVLKKPLTIKNEEEYYKYCYCYEYIPVKDESMDVAFKHMLEDLNRYFPYYAIIEKRPVDCWLLVRINTDIDLLKSKGGEVKYATQGHILQNYKLDNLVACLNMYKGMEPVINETNYNQPADVALEQDANRTFNKYPDITSMRKNLNKYGLDLIKGNREVDILVIKDKD